MNRIDRLMGFIAQLQHKKQQTAEQLAKHFGISLRTVYRDLAALNEIGVPITFEAGKGYSIAGGYFLPPVSLSTEEANALALTEPLVMRFADKHVAQHVSSALSKIKMAMASLQRDSLDRIQMQTAHYIPDEYAHLLPDSNYLSIIQQSIIQKTILHLEYVNNEEIISTRSVEPIGLTFYSLNWHLIGWCHLRQAYRDFRTSRIRRLSVTLEPFRKADHISLEVYLESMAKLTLADPPAYYGDQLKA